MGETAVPVAKMEAMKKSATNLLDAVWKLRAMATLIYHQQGDLTLDASAAEGVSLILNQLADEIRDNSDNISDSIRDCTKGD